MAPVALPVFLRRGVVREEAASSRWSSGRSSVASSVTSIAAPESPPSLLRTWRRRWTSSSLVPSPEAAGSERAGGDSTLLPRRPAARAPTAGGLHAAPLPRLGHGRGEAELLARRPWRPPPRAGVHGGASTAGRPWRAASVHGGPHPAMAELPRRPWRRRPAPTSAALLPRPLSLLPVWWGPRGGVRAPSRSPAIPLRIAGSACFQEAYRRPLRGFFRYRSPGGGGTGARCRQPKPVQYGIRPWPVALATLTGRRPFVAYSPSWSDSPRRWEGKRRRKRRKAVKSPRPLASHPNPPENTRSPNQAAPRGQGPMVVQRLGGAGRALLSLPNLRRRASNSWAAVQDTFFSTKQVFENHRIVFTVGTSIASVLTAWAGYSLRHVQQSRIDRRLESIESSLKDNHKVEHEEIKKIVTSSNISTPACVATAMTTMVAGYALGWRGGAWYARRAFRREQQKLMMGHMKSHNRWHWRPFNRLKNRLRNSRLASKNKSADTHHPSVGQSAEAPSSSGASANVSRTAQPAAGSA